MNWRFLKLGALVGVFALSAVRADQGPEGVYVGTLGTSAVVVQFQRYSDADASATYFYRRIGRDIEMNGSAQGNVWTLTERIPDAGGGDRATVKLTFGTNSATGTWTDLKKKNSSLAVRLQRATPADLAALKLGGGAQVAAWRSGDPYNALRFDAPFKTVDMQTVGGKRVQWLTEPKSSVRLPRLPGESAAVNDALTLEHLKASSDALSCPLDDYEHNATLQLYSARLVSVSATVAYYCGGAHPATGNDNYTVDLRTGRALELDALYRFTTLPATRDENSQAYANYWEAVGATLRKLILAQDGTLLKGLDAGCKDVYTDNSPLEYASWYLNARGLVVQSNLPHVAAGCENDYTLPYTSLRAYLASNSPLR
jgi:hypothetical protein